MVLQVMGKLQQHRIQNREPLQKPEGAKPLIEEIRHSAKPVDQKVQPQGTDEADAGYVILREPQKGPVRRLIALFDMPRSVSHI